MGSRVPAVRKQRNGLGRAAWPCSIRQRVVERCDLRRAARAHPELSRGAGPTEVPTGASSAGARDA